MGWILTFVICAIVGYGWWLVYSNKTVNKMINPGRTKEHWLPPSEPAPRFDPKMPPVGEDVAD